MNAINVTSWKDNFELKLLVKVKLNDNGYKLDNHIEKELDKFILSKQLEDDKRAFL